MDEMLRSQVEDIVTDLSQLREAVIRKENALYMICNTAKIGVRERFELWEEHVENKRNFAALDFSRVDSFNNPVPVVLQDFNSFVANWAEAGTEFSYEDLLTHALNIHSSEIEDDKINDESLTALVDAGKLDDVMEFIMAENLGSWLA